MGERLPRTVIREHGFEDELRVLIPSDIDADEYAEAAEFTLARDPEIGMPTAEDDVWFLTMAPIEGAQIVLYYAFDESTVWLLAIRPVN